MGILHLNIKHSSGPNSPQDASHTHPDLRISVEKAMRADEDAPKSKHIRALILSTFTEPAPHPLWSILKKATVRRPYVPMASSLADAFSPYGNASAFAGSTAYTQHLGIELMVFKALIVIHTVMREGHPSTVREVCDGLGGWLVQLRERPVFPGLKCKGSLKYDPAPSYDEPWNITYSYQARIIPQSTPTTFATISALLTLQDKIMCLQTLFFSFPDPLTECRIAVLALLAKEFADIERSVDELTSEKTLPDALQTRLNDYERHQRIDAFIQACSGHRRLRRLIDDAMFQPRRLSVETEVIDLAIKIH
ncbi:MAG: sla2 Src-like adaptor 2 [Cirrosporium novae-zelandiae]|nr:MAG: sla2 Src-like adaptor 2 [Cirrosporium novae-zelandiae]